LTIYGIDLYIILTTISSIKNDFLKNSIPTLKYQVFLFKKCDQNYLEAKMPYPINSVIFTSFDADQAKWSAGDKPTREVG
jgi:hypothetical protein